MPELPEVETVVRQLRPRLEGRHILRIKILDAKLAEIPIRNTPVSEVRRIGKEVALRLSDDRGVESRWLLIHLRMTGRLLWSQERLDLSQMTHLRAVVETDGGDVHFVDPRRFGTIRSAQGQPSGLAPGLDPTASSLTAARLMALLRSTHQDIKTWLLRQDRLCGFGNIYANEVLFVAGIHPATKTNELSDSQVHRLRKATRKVLTKAIANCGTTFSDFQDAHGVTGAYQKYLCVYGREGAPCVRCAGTVKRVVQQQRSTFFCGTCQSGP